MVIGEGRLGEGRGDRPSDISVLEESALGDTFFHPKKVVILLPGVRGWEVSTAGVVKDRIRRFGRCGA